eukprot:1956990-Karenia_brevis.AAC.1
MYIELEPHAKSRLIPILRGVRQGDPLSPAWFANTVRVTMTSLKDSWEQRGLGTLVGCNFQGRNRITYAMFADDTTLVAKSRQALQKMLKEVTVALARIGLNLNADKCSIQ